MQPQNPSPNYDFIMNAGQEPKRGRLPSFGLPQPLTIGLGVVVLVLVLAIGFSALAPKNTSGQSVVGLAGQAQEISRVSSEVNQDSPGGSNDLAATVSTILTNQQTNLTKYLASTKTKVDPKQLAAAKDTSVDTQLQTALHNNSLPAFYVGYLKAKLTAYDTNLKSAYSSAKDVKLKTMLAGDHQAIAPILMSI